MYICHHVGGDSDICDLELITPIKFCGNQASCFHQVVVVVVVLLLYVPSQQLWSLRDGQFT